MITPSFSLTATERVLPRLALDFTTASLDPRITFTRAGNTATVVNSSGLIAGINADLPRFDYDPVTLVCKGLLIEESRSNLLTYSALFGGTGWTTLNSGVASLPTITTNYATSPDGTTSASRVQMSLNGGTSASDWTVVQHLSFAQTNGAAYAQSIYLKSNDGNTYTVLLRDDTGSGTAKLLTVTPQWQRFTQNVTASTATALGIKIWLRGTLGTSTTADILAWGGQYEAGAFATSYIPTTSAALTRNADVATMTGTNFSDWYNNTAGSLEATFTPVLGNFGANRYPVAISNGTSAESLAIRMSSGAFIGYCLTGGVNQYFNNAGTAANNTQATCCMSLGTSGGIFAANATLGAAGGAAIMPTVNRLALGEFTGVAQGAYTFQKIMYYPQRLTNSETRAFSKG